MEQNKDLFKKIKTQYGPNLAKRSLNRDQIGSSAFISLTGNQTNLGAVFASVLFLSAFILEIPSTHLTMY